MYLFFDTETTGLPISWKAPLNDLNNWPRLVQLAWTVYDFNQVELERENIIIKPEGFIIPSTASKIHGISHRHALKYGIPLEHALKNFSSKIKRSSFVIAHNMRFDESIVNAEFLRTGMENQLTFRTKICTMRKATNFCRIPGFFGYKWPKLSELHYKLFGEDFTNAHNAAVDVEITAKCFWEMKKRGLF